MPAAPIPFVSAEESGLEELAGASPAAHNVVVDGKGAVRRRPGIQQYTTAAFHEDGESVDLVHRVFGGDIYVAQRVAGTANRRLYRLGNPDAGLDDLGGLNGPARIVSAETEGMLALALGRAPYRVDLSTKELGILGGSPPKATHIVAHAGRLISNDLDQASHFRFSGIQTGAATGRHETWRATDFFAAEARPDRVLALGENSNELFVWGESSLQVFGNDPQTVFAPVATIEHGTASPYSIVKRDQTFAWLDHRRRFIVSDGRSKNDISGGMRRTLDDMSVVDDCFGFWVSHGVADCLAWVFPTEGVTLVHQGGAWGRWTGWDTNNDVWAPFPVSSFHQRTNDNVPTVGTTSGRVGRLTFDSQTDLGTPIKAYVQTGYLDRDTDARKVCRRLRLTLKRGHTTSAVEPELIVGWRDRPGDWTRLPVRLGASGETDPVVVLDALGTYRRRQWYFEFAGGEELVLARATEEFDILAY